MDTMEVLTKCKGMTIKYVKDLSSNTKNKFQIGFEDGSILVLTSIGLGFGVEATEIEAELYTE